MSNFLPPLVQSIQFLRRIKLLSLERGESGTYGLTLTCPHQPVAKYVGYYRLNWTSAVVGWQEIGDGQGLKFKKRGDLDGNGKRRK